MLNTAEPRRPKRTPRSLRSEYEEFIDQRIEEYKDALPRAEILGIGDEAVQELSRSQFDVVDEIAGRPNGYVPHHLPGSSGAQLKLTEFASQYRLPVEAVRGGAHTTYPEYQLTVQRQTATAASPVTQSPVVSGFLVPPQPPGGEGGSRTAVAAAASSPSSKRA